MNLKKLADRCDKISAILTLIVAGLAFFPHIDLFRKAPILVGVLLLPVTILKVIVTVVHHLLPPNQREPLDVSWWGLRLHIDHPYWSLLIAVAMNVLCFLEAFPETPFAFPLLLLLAFTLLFAEIFAVGYDRWRRKRHGDQKKRH